MESTVSLINIVVIALCVSSCQFDNECRLVKLKCKLPKILLFPIIFLFKFGCSNHTKIFTLDCKLYIQNLV